MLNFAVFASGEGTNLQAIIQAVQKNQINANLKLVFSNRRRAKALKRAEAAEIKTLFLDPKNYTNPQSFERDLVIHLKEEKIDFIVLAGYMRVVSAFMVKQYPNKIINIHPSLLPAFKGARAIKDTFTYGAKVSGVTVHFVDEKLDHGPIILQQGFMLKEDETLEALEKKIHAVEHKLYPKAIALYADKKLKISGRKVTIVE